VAINLVTDRARRHRTEVAVVEATDSMDAVVYSSPVDGDVFERSSLSIRHGAGPVADFSFAFAGEGAG
jgi:hypothetical protein